MTDRAATELVQLGLTRYEAKAYLALIGRDHGTPAEIARIGQIPRPRAYDVLASLAERGFVVPVSDARGVRYRANAPDQVFDSLLAVRRRDLDQLASRSRELAIELQTRFLDGQGRGEPLDYVEVLRDPAHTVQRINRLWQGAQEEILAMVRPPYLAPPASDEASLPERPNIRGIYARSLLEDPRLVELLEAYVRLGEEIRVSEEVPLKLTIVDGQSVAFNMPDPVEDDSSVTTIVVHHRDLAATLRIAFETLWESAERFPAPRR
ncbi:MAG TPA: helix-turn-helix domain-containing protein [Beutenbergiaceae bacterium]|nr:helix-turn-helix domain-containing protein [Beutenbergiaceae bacterium]